MEQLRKVILRVLMVSSFPMTYVVFWLIGGPHWQDDFWSSVRIMWHADRR